jgi:hypothetical protein
VDNDGNVYVTGWTDGNLDGNVNVGYNDMFLTKFDSSGTRQWTREYGTPGPSSADLGLSVKADKTGYIYVSGFTCGDLNGVPNAGGLSDGFLMRFDSSGNLQWTKLLGSPGIDSGPALAIDDSANVYVAGWTTGQLDGNTSSGGRDIFLASYDSSGNVQWIRQFGTPADEICRSVAVDTRGHVYLTGCTAGALDGNPNAGGGEDVFLTKFDSLGNRLWTTLLGSPGEDSGTSVAIDQSGNIYVSGYTDGSLDGNVNIGSMDFFLAAFDSSGERQWTRQLGTPYYEYPGTMAIASGGNIYTQRHK